MPAVRAELAGWMHNAYLVQWIRKKYKRLAGLKKALRAMAGAATRYPRLFAHWQWTTSASLTW